MLGIASFQPLVNPPQVAILSVGAGHGDAGRTTTLGLAADHRAVDGAQGARFLQTLREVVETADPGVLAGSEGGG
jgi:pyruvate dehydrogenase E2 component (dihydrolipoamide acetyltransferase)